MVACTLAFLVPHQVLGRADRGQSPDTKDAESAVLRRQLAVLRRQVARPPLHANRPDDPAAATCGRSRWTRPGRGRGTVVPRGVGAVGRERGPGTRVPPRDRPRDAAVQIALKRRRLAPDGRQRRSRWWGRKCRRRRLCVPHRATTACGATPRRRRWHEAPTSVRRMAEHLPSVSAAVGTGGAHRAGAGRAGVAWRGRTAGSRCSWPARVSRWWCGCSPRRRRSYAGVSRPTGRSGGWAVRRGRPGSAGADVRVVRSIR
jgi:hypothetical protein